MWRESPGISLAPSHDPCVSSQILKTWDASPPATVQVKVCILGRDLRKFYGHPGGGFYAPWKDSLTFQVMTLRDMPRINVRAFTFIRGSSRLSCFTASASWVAHYNRNSLSHEPLTTFKTIGFCEVLMGVCPLPPKKRKTSSFHSILAVALTYKQLQTCVFKKASHIIKKARSPPWNRGKLPKRTKKNEKILKQLHGNRDILRNPVTPLKGPWQTRTIKQSGLHRSAHVFAEGPLRLFGASPPENQLSKTMSESFFGQLQFVFATIPWRYIYIYIYIYLCHKKEKNRHKSHTQNQKKTRETWPKTAPMLCWNYQREIPATKKWPQRPWV